MTNFYIKDQELFSKALDLVKEGLLVTPHEFAEKIVDFVKDYEVHTESPATPKAGGNQVDNLLLAFVQNFAFQDDEGNWWGMDTNLGKCEDAFAEAKKSIEELL